MDKPAVCTMQPFMWPLSNSYVTNHNSAHCASAFALHVTFFCSMRMIGRKSGAFSVSAWARAALRIAGRYLHVASSIPVDVRRCSVAHRYPAGLAQHKLALSKANRSMPEAWWGLRDAKLSEVSGIPGCVFCHASGFIGGNDSYEGVLAMARASLPPK
jgi:hypothetical protein